MAFPRSLRGMDDMTISEYMVLQSVVCLSVYVTLAKDGVLKSISVTFAL